MSVSERVKRVVWIKAGGCCAICREHLLIATTSGSDSHLLGEVAHIVAEQNDGPRGVSRLTAKERNNEPNLLLLCLNHHKIIDDDPLTYTTSNLHEIKKEHIAWIASRLQLEYPWQTKLHNFYYINVPRLNLLAATLGVSLDLSRYGEIMALHELGWELNGLMLRFKNLLANIELKSISFNIAAKQGHAARGLLVSFDNDFRTKNIYVPENSNGYKNAIRGDLNKDPHIYSKILDTKIVLVIDPRWVTTTTAFVQFRPQGGKGKFAGLGIVNSCAPEKKLMSVSPLLIGLPSNPFLDAFYRGT